MPKTEKLAPSVANEAAYRVALPAGMQPDFAESLGSGTHDEATGVWTFVVPEA